MYSSCRLHVLNQNVGINGPKTSIVKATSRNVRARAGQAGSAATAAAAAMAKPKPKAQA